MFKFVTVSIKTRLIMIPTEVGCYGAEYCRVVISM